MSDMFMFTPTKFFYAMLIIYLSAILIIVFGWNFIFGEDFKYNMTKRMQDETKLLDFCISNTTIKIPDVEKFCALSYGGLNTSYGESVDK